jgi:hypothetical protein
VALRRLVLSLIVASAVAHCGGEPPTRCVGYPEEIVPVHDDTARLDLLVAIDDSPRMSEASRRVGAQLDALIASLIDPGCSSPTVPTPHPCSGAADEWRIRDRVDLHAAVVSADLGTGGVAVDGCGGGSRGDDGTFDPVARGTALTTHPPDSELRTGCDPADVPPFVEFDSFFGEAAPAREAFRCSAILGSAGCIAQQPLEAMYRALVEQRADDHADNAGPNAGFLRDTAFLALLVVSDADDFSVRDCAHAEPGQGCDDATSVFDLADARWPGADLLARMDRYTPGGANDPTWPLDRYLDPADPTRGFARLKAGHPERIMFAAITGVPNALPTIGSDARPSVDWDALLGRPGARGDDDFEGRDRSGLATIDSDEGPVTMRPAQPDPSCAARTLPACRREGTTYDASMPACTRAAQDWGTPSPRLVEMARRFAISPRCYGSPCGRGSVTSICRDDWTPVLAPILYATGCRLIGYPIAHPETVEASDGTRTVTCRVFETEPDGRGCEAARGRRTPGDRVLPSSVVVDGENRSVCEVTQIPTRADGMPAADGAGWYWLDSPNLPICSRQIHFTRRAESPLGAIVDSYCSNARRSCAE